MDQTDWTLRRSHLVTGRFTIKQADYLDELMGKGYGTSEEIVEDAIASFKRKMEKHTGGPIG